MSLKRIVLISAAAHMSGPSNRDSDSTPRPPPVPVHGVNVVLGGAMMSGILIMVFLICYCCHRNQQKRQTNLPRYWRDPGLSMEVYTVEGQQLYDVHDELTAPVNQGPPPPYEAVVTPDFEHKEESDLKNIIKGRRNDDTGLPSYEAAIQMAHNEGRIV